MNRRQWESSLSGGQRDHKFKLLRPTTRAEALEQQIKTIPRGASSRQVHPYFHGRSSECHAADEQRPQILRKHFRMSEPNSCFPWNVLLVSNFAPCKCYSRGAVPCPWFSTSFAQRQCALLYFQWKHIRFKSMFSNVGHCKYETSSRELKVDEDVLATRHRTCYRSNLGYLPLGMRPIWHNLSWLQAV